MKKKSTPKLKKKLIKSVVEMVEQLAKSKGWDSKQKTKTSTRQCFKTT